MSRVNVIPVAMDVPGILQKTGISPRQTVGIPVDFELLVQDILNRPWQQV